MTISEYISQKFASLGLVSSEADLMDMGLFNSSENLTIQNRDSIHLAFVKHIPTLLLRPAALSEGGVSISRAQRQDIESYYNLECKKLGIRNEIAPRVRFL